MEWDEENNLGSYLNKRRKQANLTLRELAAATGLSQSYLSDLESGKCRNPTAKTIILLTDKIEITWCTVLSCVESDLLDRDNEL